MAGKLDFAKLDNVTAANPSEPLVSTEGRSARWKSRDTNPVVQMSIRLPENDYDRFRALCAQERRTNGDMLRVLMEGFFAAESQRK